MKKIIFIFAMLFAFVAVPEIASATTITQYATQTTANGDVDLVGEAVSTAFSGLCAWVDVRNAPQYTAGFTADVVYIGLISSTVDTTAAASLPSWGHSLYPTDVSGDQSWRIEPQADPKGIFYGINPDYVYAAAAGVNNRVEMECMPCRATAPDGLRCTK